MNDLEEGLEKMWYIGSDAGPSPSAETRRAVARNVPIVDQQQGLLGNKYNEQNAAETSS